MQNRESTPTGTAHRAASSENVVASAPFALHHCDELESTGLVTAFFNEGSYEWRDGFLSENATTSTAARANFEQLATQTGISPHRMVLTIQTHTGTVRAVGREHAGEGITRPHTTGDHDALITNEPGLLLCVLTADCLPIYLLDPAHRAIGLVHSGWRGTVKLIGPAALEQMAARYGTRACDVLVHFGPSICGACYEVGHEVRDEFARTFSEEELQRFFVSKSDAREKYLLDNELAARTSLLHAGVLPEHITTCGICTFEDARFESYRRTGATKERILSGYMLKI